MLLETSPFLTVKLITVTVLEIELSLTVKLMTATLLETSPFLTEKLLTVTFRNQGLPYCEASSKYSQPFVSENKKCKNVMY